MSIGGLGMIKMIRDFSSSITMTFDEDGNKELLEGFKNALNPTVPGVIEVCFDKAVLTLKKHTIESVKVTILRDGNVDYSTIERVEDSIVWKLDEEDIDMGIEFFERSMQKGYFFPAEFIYAKIAKNKKHIDHMYCKRI